MTFKLTKDYVLSSFAPLAEIHDLAKRKTFFTESIDSSNITWTITGDHSLSGTRTTLEAHAAASFDRLGPKLSEPIRFLVTRIIVDAERTEESDPEKSGWWACVETRGEATIKTGEPYNNEYVWLMRWNDHGKIVEIRSYFDSLMSEYVLHREIPEDSEKKP
ncbi:hypothetical protein ACO1O0_007070 [Amphichorda felina]